MNEVSKATHTSGPWELHAMLMGESTRICKPTPKKNWQGCEDIAVAVNPADARLIAAAPELLEALEAIVHSWDSTHIDGQSYDAAEAAINKARGAS